MEMTKAKWHFECPLCGHDRYSRVRFPRPDGTFYIEAPIYQCLGCTVMFGDKDVFMKIKVARSEQRSRTV
jgi:hypothetical protein